MCYLNKMYFRFKVKLNLHYVPFVSHLKKQQFIFSAVVHFHKIFGHKLIPNISPQCIIFGFMEDLQDQHNITINQSYSANLQTLCVSVKKF